MGLLASRSRVKQRGGMLKAALHLAAEQVGSSRRGQWHLSSLSDARVGSLSDGMLSRYAGYVHLPFRHRDHSAHYRCCSLLLMRIPITGDASTRKSHNHTSCEAIVKASCHVRKPSLYSLPTSLHCLIHHLYLNTHSLRSTERPQSLKPLLSSL